MHHIMVLKHNGEGKEFIRQQHTKSLCIHAGLESKDIAEARTRGFQREKLIYDQHFVLTPEQTISALSLFY